MVATATLRTDARVAIADGLFLSQADDAVVRAENLNPDVLVMQPANQGV